MDRVKYERILTSTGFPFKFGSLEAGDIGSELIRKSFHFLIALCPAIAAVSKPFMVLILVFGVLSYALMEYLRVCGIKVPVVSSITSIVSRSRSGLEIGPVTLGLGALLALLLFPSPVAAIAIYAMAFGDGFAALIGKSFGKWRPVFLHGKSIEGSMACFFSVLICTYKVSNRLDIAFIAAFTAAVVEAMPLKNYDNLALPLIVGLVVQTVGFSL